MYTTMKRFFQQLSLLFALLLVLGFPKAFADERVFIPASSDGPMTDLKNAGKSVDLLPSLEHENGDKLKPSEMRVLKDKGFYLPNDAIPDRAGRVVFVREELELFGPAKVVRTSKERVSSKLLSQANDKIKELDSELAAANKSLISLQYQLKNANDRIQETKGRFPWGWLLFLLIGWAVAAFVIWYLLGKRFQIELDQALRLQEQKGLSEKIDANKQSIQIEELSGNIRTLTTELNKACQEVDRLTERISLMQATNDWLNRNWNNLTELRARITALENEQGFAAGSSAGG